MTFFGRKNNRKVQYPLVEFMKEDVGPWEILERLTVKEGIIER
jgi:hypothetical protein